MDHIHGPKTNTDLATGGKNEETLGQNDVVFGRRILLVETDEVQLGLIDQFRIGSTEDAVLAREPEVPGELLGHHLNDQWGLPLDSGTATLKGTSVDLGVHEEGHQHRCGERGPEHLHPDVLAKNPGFARPSDESHHQGDVRAEEDDAGDDQIQGDRRVDPSAVGGQGRKRGCRQGIGRPRHECRGEERENARQTATVVRSLKTHEPSESMARTTSRPWAPAGPG